MVFIGAMPKHTAKHTAKFPAEYSVVRIEAIIREAAAREIAARDHVHAAAKVAARTAVQTDLAVIDSILEKAARKVASKVVGHKTKLKVDLRTLWDYACGRAAWTRVAESDTTIDEADVRRYSQHLIRLIFNVGLVSRGVIRSCGAQLSVNPDAITETNELAVDAFLRALDPGVVVHGVLAKKARRHPAT